jgi:hypothetical protein
MDREGSCVPGDHRLVLDRFCSHIHPLFAAIAVVVVSRVLWVWCH